MHAEAGREQERRPAVLGSTLFAAGLLVSTLVFAPIALLTFPLPLRWRFLVISRWALVNLGWLRLTCGIRWEVEGREHIPATPGIVMCKHQSAWETLALQALFQPSVWVLKRELLWIPFFGWSLAMLRPIAIDRRAGRRAMQQIVNQGVDRLRDGCWVVVFPEGTRIAPGQRGRYRPGGALLAARSGLPVTPVAHNAGHCWPPRSFLKYPGTIRMTVGEPIPSQGRSPEAILAEVESWVETTVARLDAGAG